jgi:hypothetical protein
MSESDERPARFFAAATNDFGARLVRNKGSVPRDFNIEI